MPSSRMYAWTDSSRASNSAATNPSCRSRSAGTKVLPDAIGFMRFRHQHGKRRNVRVPFDQRGNGAESFERVRVERPDFIADGRVVCVDANVTPADRLNA